jgi:hypothetical protein
MTSPSPPDHLGAAADHPPPPDEASLLQVLLEEQKQLADSMNRHYQRLEEQVLDLSHALDNIGGYVFMKDRQGRYTYANRLVRELFRPCGHDEIMPAGMTAHFFRRTPLEDRSTAMTAGSLKKAAYHQRRRAPEPPRPPGNPGLLDRQDAAV